MLERCRSRNVEVRTDGPDCGWRPVNCLQVLTRAEQHSTGFSATTLNGVTWTHGAHVHKVKALRVVLDGVVLIDWCAREWNRRRQISLIRCRLQLSPRQSLRREDETDTIVRCSKKGGTSSGGTSSGGTSSGGNKTNRCRSRSAASVTLVPRKQHRRRNKKRSATVDVLDFFDLPLPLSNERHIFEVTCRPPEYLGAFYITSVDVYTIADRWSLRDIAQSHMTQWRDLVNPGGRSVLLHSVRDMVPLARAVGEHWPGLPFELARLIASMYMQDADIETAAYVSVCTMPTDGKREDEKSDRRSLQWLFYDTCMVCGVAPPGQPATQHALYATSRANESWTGLVCCTDCFRVVSAPLLERGWQRVVSGAVDDGHAFQNPQHW